MKTTARILSLTLCVLLLFSCALPAPAEGTDQGDEKTRSEDRQYIRLGIALAADMAGNALDLLDSTETGPVRGQLALFSKLPYLSPDRAVIVTVDRWQTGDAKRAVGTDKWTEFAPALADSINRRFSESYAQAAGMVQTEKACYLSVTTDNCCLLLLSYGEELAVITHTNYGQTSSNPDHKGSYNGGGSFIISTREIGQNIGQADIEPYLQEYSVRGASVRVYDRDALNGLLTEAEWSSGNNAGRVLINSVVTSDLRTRTMMPGLMDSDSPYLSDTLKYGVLIRMLELMEQADQTLIREVAGKWLPALAGNRENPTEFFLDQRDEASGSVAPPETAFGEELREGAELKPDGTYLVTFLREIPERDPAAWYDVLLEAALPTDRIPASVEEADYIICCHVTYDGGINNGDAHLHYPRTHITVHDARTGEMLRDLGTVRRTLKGAMMIGRGDTWWEPLRTKLWEIISKLFTE